MCEGLTYLSKNTPTDKEDRVSHIIQLTNLLSKWWLFLHCYYPEFPRPLFLPLILVSTSSPTESFDLSSIPLLPLIFCKEGNDDLLIWSFKHLLA